MARDNQDDIGNSAAPDASAEVADATYHDVQRCPECGAEITDRLIYCGSCGYRLIKPEIEDDTEQDKQGEMRYIIGTMMGIAVMLCFVILIVYKFFS